MSAEVRKAQHCHTCHDHIYHAGPSDAGVEQLKAALISMVPADVRTTGAAKSFLFAVDHCFPIKGQGTVLTGTVLQVCLCACLFLFYVCIFVNVSACSVIYANV